MAANIEIKARVSDMAQVQALAELLSDTPRTILNQEDVFFNTPQGRLKLRILSPQVGELIYYTRMNTAGPKRSDYAISRTAEPQVLKAVLAAAWGIRGEVRKRRYLYLVEQTRIHLDDVAGLGTFLELEVVLQPGQSDLAGQVIADDLMRKLEISPADLIDVAYIDLLDLQARSG